jgi:hypothetical protein
MATIDQFTVYDPKQDGIDYQKFKKVFQIDKIAATELLGGLTAKMLLSTDGKSPETLYDFLFGPEERMISGYFATNPEIMGVIFFEGKFYDKMLNQRFPNGYVEFLAEKNNSIPLVVFNDPDLYFFNYNAYKNYDPRKSENGMQKFGLSQTE